MGQLVHHNFGHPDPVLDKKQLAHHWGRTVRYIEKLVNKGLPSRMERRDGRQVRVFPLYDCENWLQANTKGASDAEARVAVRG